ncbi:MAG: penicillin-binding protein 2 [Acidaminococcales bacterium]|jgi:penicillin-binding protein 2|nr:penicillin-binding protein 2 [Acidaminococcales bacterium]
MITKKYAYRFECISLLGALLFLVLTCRIAYLQLYEGDYYKRQSDGNRIRLTPIMAPRGLFYDRNGVPLVNNRPGFTLVVNAKETGFTPEVARRLSEIIHIPESDIMQKVEKNKDNFEPVLLKNDLTPEMMTQVEEKRAVLPGVMIIIQPLRTYLFGETAAHVIGYVGEISEAELKSFKGEGSLAGGIIGKMGLEQYYDNILRGQDGGTWVEVDVAGRIVQEIGKREPSPGHSVYLTIDIEVQKAAEQALDKHLEWLRKNGGSPNAFAAAIVAVDPRDGAVLALVSRPAFDPNAFVSGISQKDWDALSRNPYNPLNNKAISGEYPPGSTFKMVTGSAALEMGKVTPKEKIFDAGYHRAVPQKGNYGGGALGWIDFNEALIKSDNVYFYELAYRLGPNNLEKYARGFGYGQRTGINLFGESEGVVAGVEYKKLMFNEDWYLAETFDAGIGQGFHLATPLQMAVSIAGIANGGVRYQPYLVSRIVSDKGELVERIEPKQKGRLPMSEETARLIKKALRAVAQEGGTAWQLANFPIPLAGKTGTSENSHGRDHGLFVAYAPADNPEIAVAVLVEQGGPGSVAAIPVTKEILEQYFNVGRNKSGKNK